MADGRWVYGVVGDQCPEPAVDGVDGAPVRLVRAAGLAALASPVPLEHFGAEPLRQMLEDLDRVEALARAHQGVLDRALELDGVVPFRMCTIYDSEAHVREMLERERESLAGSLARLRGSAEWGVKAYAVKAPKPDPEPADEESGTAWLRRKRDDRASAEAAEQAAAERVAGIHERLAEQAAAATLSRPHDRRLSGHEGDMVLNAAYLVAHARADDFRAAVERLGRDHARAGLRLVLTGPWAPYHFVGEDAR